MMMTMTTSSMIMTMTTNVRMPLMFVTMTMTTILMMMTRMGGWRQEGGGAGNRQDVGHRVHRTTLNGEGQRVKKLANSLGARRVLVRQRCGDRRHQFHSGSGCPLSWTQPDPPGQLPTHATTRPLTDQTFVLSSLHPGPPSDKKYVS